MGKSKAIRKHIVVIGGGFAGLNFARQLFKNKFYDVTLVDKNNYNYFTPLLYQVATGFLEPSAISYPFRRLFKNKEIAFRMATVLKIDTNENLLYLSDGPANTEGSIPGVNLKIFAAFTFQAKTRRLLPIHLNVPFHQTRMVCL